MMGARGGRAEGVGVRQAAGAGEAMVFNVTIPEGVTAGQQLQAPPRPTPLSLLALLGGRVPRPPSARAGAPTLPTRRRLTHRRRR
jgi:hypothetical protein